MMSRTKKNLWVLCSIGFFFLFVSCQPATTKQDESVSKTDAKEKTEAEKYQEWVEKHPTATDRSDANEEIEGTLYRNNKYKFHVRFIEGWSFRKGDSKTAVIKSVQADSGKSITLLVEDYPDMKLKNRTLNQQELSEQKLQFIEILKIQNIQPTNLKIENGYLNNFPALIITFNSIARSQTMEIEYAHKQIHCINDGRLYNIAVSMPNVLFDNKEIKRINRVIESFVFEKGM